MLNEYLIKNNKKIAYREIDGEIIIINLEKSTFHSLDPVASLIWNEANGKNKVKQIIEKVSQNFEVNTETAINDCTEFIDDLINKELAYLSSNTVEKD